MQEEQQTIYFNLAHDGSTRYIKDHINGKTTIFPSVIADFMPRMQNIIVDSNSRDDVENFLNDFINNMDVTTNSKGISDNGRYFVGQAAAYSGVHVITFNVNNAAGKHTTISPTDKSTHGNNNENTVNHGTSEPREKEGFTNKKKREENSKQHKRLPQDPFEIFKDGNKFE